jgi:hypothetical protein
MEIDSVFINNESVPLQILQNVEFTNTKFSHDQKHTTKEGYDPDSTSTYVKHLKNGNLIKWIHETLLIYLCVGRISENGEDKGLTKIIIN